MKILRIRIPFVLMIAMTFTAPTSFPSISHGEELSRWELKTSAVVIDANRNSAFDQPAGGQLRADGDTQIGLGIALEYRYSGLFSFELARVSATAMDVDYTTGPVTTKIGEGVRFTPVLFGANIHFIDTKNVNAYAGPRVAYVNFGGFSAEINGETVGFEVDNEFAWGAAAGAKYQIGESAWSLLAEVTYLEVDTKVAQNGTSEAFVDSYNPLMLTVGLSHRF